LSEKIPFLAARDPITFQAQRITSSGATPGAPQQILFGDSFHGTVLDTSARWTKNETGLGTVVQGDGQVLLSTGAGVGHARIKSVPQFALYSGSELLFTAVVRRGTVPMTGNNMFIGLEVSGANYFHWALQDASWKALASFGGGGLLDQVISDPRIDELEYMKLQIRLTKSRVQFIANDQLQKTWESQGGVDALNFGSLCYVWAECTNVSGSANNYVYISEMSVVRSFENWPGPAIPADIAASTLIARGPCWYLGTKKVSGTNGIIIRDDLSATGRVVDRWASGGGYAPPPGPIECQKGIYAEYASGTDPAIIYYALA